MEASKIAGLAKWRWPRKSLASKDRKPTTIGLLLAGRAHVVVGVLDQELVQIPAQLVLGGNRVQRRTAVDSQLIAEYIQFADVVDGADGGDHGVLSFYSRSGAGCRFLGGRSQDRLPASYLL